MTFGRNHYIAGLGGKPAQVRPTPKVTHCLSVGKTSGNCGKNRSKTTLLPHPRWGKFANLPSLFSRHHNRCFFSTWSRPPCQPKAASDHLALRQDFPGDAAVNIGQSEITAGVRVREPFVVQAEQMQDSRMQIMRVHFALDG